MEAKAKKLSSSILVVTFLISVVIFVLPTINVASATGGDEWPMFHHDLAHSGHSSSTLPTTSNVLWNYATSGAIGYSSPAVSEGAVYVGSYDTYVYAFDALTGHLNWRSKTGSGIWSSPAVFGGVVYVGSMDGTVYALDTATGNKLWTKGTGDSIESSPAVSDGLVYIGSNDGFLYALSSATGDVVWSHPSDGPVVSSPAVVNGVVYAVLDGDRVVALNAETGVDIWGVTTNVQIVTSPTVSDGRVYLGLWNQKIVALDATTGANIWSYTTGNTIRSSPAVWAGVVYAGSDDGKVYALNAATGAYIWSYATYNSVYSSPAVANGVVYVGSFDDTMYALNAATGALVWRFTTTGPFVCSPAVWDGRVYAGSFDDNIYCFGAPSESDTQTVNHNSVTVDQTAKTGFEVTVSGPSLQDNTQITVTSADYDSSQPPGTAALPASGGLFYDLKVTSSSGSLGNDVNAIVSITNPVITSSDIMCYWDGTNWIPATNLQYNPATNTLTATIPANALAGTPIATGQANLFSVPEYILGALLSLIACCAAFMIFAAIKKNTKHITLPNRTH